ncbi:MAG: SAM-dependent methyltransferase [Betaproteobacteria bacterium RIFCSPLOWO2_12_FULL_66_14]|nr:MAG: SAM-dependent methyltransferase [Betaproteobacteria bacterium RIFCSPLOWO2_12_FULL_66_14]
MKPLRAPAAERNKDPILAVLQRTLPSTGLVLEIASGTGQHVVHFARALAALTWQPSDSDRAARDSISAWIALEQLANVKQPLDLDVCRSPWPVKQADAIVCINMIHIAPWAAAEALAAGAGRILPPGGVLFLYGPYRRSGSHTAPSNELFDAGLRSQNPAWGVRDMESVEALAANAGLSLEDIVAMPANNFSLVFRRKSA